MTKSLFTGLERDEIKEHLEIKEKSKIIILTFKRFRGFNFLVYQTN